MAATDHRAALLEEDGTLIIRASAVGHCTTQLVGAALMEPITEPANWLQEKFVEGHIAEQLILAHFRNRSRLVSIPCTGNGDWPVDADPWPAGLYSSEIDGEPLWAVEIEVADGIFVKGHIDDLAYDPATGQLYGIEAKAVGDMLQEQITNGGLRSNGGYWWQVSGYGHALGIPWYFVVGHKDEHGQWRPPTDGTMGLYVEKVEGNQRVPLAAMRGRLNTVAEWVEAKIEGSVTAEQWPEGCDESAACPYPQLHPSQQVQDWSGPGVGIELPIRTQLREAAAKDVEAGSLSYRAKKMKEEAREVIERILGGDHGEIAAGRPGRVNLGDVTVSYSKTYIEPATVARKGYDRTNISVKKNKAPKKTRATKEESTNE